MLSDVDSVPVGPMLSMFDPVYVGIDEAGLPVYVPMMYNNLLVGGVPGAGKSVFLSDADILRLVAYARRIRPPQPLSD